MDKFIQALLAVGPNACLRAQKIVSMKDQYAKSCQTSILSFREALDNKWLFINYIRRNDKSKGEKYGVAVSFFVDGRLFAGQSICMMKPQMPTKKAFAEAAHIVTIATGTPVTADSLRKHYAHELLAMSPTHDEWRRHIGIWKAIESAREVPLTTATELALQVDHRFNQLRASTSVRLFKMANVAAHVSRTHDILSFTEWLIGGDPDAPTVPYRAHGAVVGAIVAAMNSKAKRESETLAVPASV